ncbi:MAG: 3-deoxy-D-manno-octulosonic acid transferase [Bacteroidales bacterium]
MIYSLLIRIYYLIIRLVSLFNPKAKLLIDGQAQTFATLKAKIDPTADYLWFHAASSGEFEQGRPLMEAIRKQHSNYKIIVTFYSPSGYEVRKNYTGADVICYLPADTRTNVNRFLDLVKPKKAIFIKYEFWHNYLHTLKKRGIETYIISAIFREKQLFFKWYGGWYRQMLLCFDHLFLQDEQSAQLLATLGVKNVTVCGDTRFDRVRDIQSLAKPLPILEKFANSFTLIAGSSWPKDEDIFIEYFNEHPEMKLVIAPHEIDEEHLDSIISKLKRPFLKYSDANEANILQADCLIIDCFGLLSSIYRYGNVAYIGGGFGVGIHNLTEAAVYGIPVVFGPNFAKFREAHELIACGGGFTINDLPEFASLMDQWIKNSALLKENGAAAGNYIHQNKGATNAILQGLNL